VHHHAQLKIQIFNARKITEDLFSDFQEIKGGESIGHNRYDFKCLNVKRQILDKHNDLRRVT
jgi:hypothetical protein